MSISPSSPPVATVFGALLPIMAAVLIGFLVIGAAVPVLPLDVQTDLKFGPFIVGLVTGSRFAASLLARVWAGRTCDRYGLRRAVLVGLIARIAAGSFYLGSLPFNGTAGAISGDPIGRSAWHCIAGVGSEPLRRLLCWRRWQSWRWWFLCARSCPNVNRASGCWPGVGLGAMFMISAVTVLAACQSRSRCWAAS